VQVLLSCVALVVLTLGGRVRPGFLPVRDHVYFISHSTKLSAKWLRAAPVSAVNARS
jgi:hypothetical protein